VVNGLSVSTQLGSFLRLLFLIVSEIMLRVCVSVCVSFARIFKFLSASLIFTCKKLSIVFQTIAFKIF